MIIDSKLKGDEGENFVNEIAYKSFFKYWCYPGPKYENGDKKEICDLLIVFNDICIIFSVKNYEFKGNHIRYFNNTIEKAVRQLNGAYKTLFKKDKVEIKHPNRDVEEFPRNQIKKIFKIIINLGEGVDFYDITRTQNNSDFITIFDKETFQTIAEELDTIPDFIDYLEKRELLFKNKTVQVISPNLSRDLNENDHKYLNENIENSIKIIGTEKDLLAYFFTNVRSFPKVITDNSEKNYMVINIEGAWEIFKNSPNAIKKEFADLSSYFVDEFVMNEILNRKEPLMEEIAKELLSLNRLQRRAVGISFDEFFNDIRNSPEGMHRRRFMEHGNLALVFFNFFPEWGTEALLKMFDLIFETFAFYYQYRHQTFILIGVSSDPYFTFQMHKNYGQFDVEDEEIIKANIKELGWFTDYNEQIKNVDEFPQ
ncbi:MULTISPECIES: hypothetical protein [Elizabethkingia]|uniref:hypothetical protein n=1 Tax=Elizabethkingia TaxID=308865 RepID=UPI00099990AC|nr:MULTISPECIES: hypothetical protein [Elizabethkingia]AQX90590.1 hypothetical protein AYC67_16910 [Elizabethkingia anophelis]EHM7981739.1 hypothetical protein [Elizabethkingia anophelis]EHM8032237.1 hypothetical protein [Elizabethkingia anophelis]EHZ9535191.1 hypothetical protein [Elizabethkingia anophelis]EKU3673101.1 hypothetical protein [Elizabethkingia anophelis]